MGEFPSGQRGQTVNLLSTTSVVRIHSPPPLTKSCMKHARLLLYVAKLFWSDFLHWVGNGQSWNIASCFARLHIKMDIADKVSAYSFCEFGVAPPAFCPDPHPGLACRLGRFASTRYWRVLTPHAEMVRNNRRVPGAFLTHTVVSPVGSVGSQLVCHWQTLTPHAEINGNGWLLPGRKFQPFFSFDPHSHDLVHEISHLLGGLLLLLAGGVGVGAKGETCIFLAVSQPENMAFAFLPFCYIFLTAHILCLPALNRTTHKQVLCIGAASLIHNNLYHTF